MLLAEHHIYGSSRLGVKTYDSLQQRVIFAGGSITDSSLNVARPWYEYGFGGWVKGGSREAFTDSTYNLFSDTLRGIHWLGVKRYELTDHLVNVLATVLDRKTGSGSSSGNYTGYTADLFSATDYYPFGFEMPGRSSNSAGARFGYNGQMKDNDIAGVGNHNTALFWEYDMRIGRRWNVDPVDQISISNYATFNNNPVLLYDKLGDSTTVFANKNGTYSVVNSFANKNRNIYVVDRKKKLTGEVIGKAATQYSFLDDNGKAVKGAIINLKDNSGTLFLGKEIIGSRPLLPFYMYNARNGRNFDFKDRNIDNRTHGMTKDQYRYRAMLLNVRGFEKNVIATARDIGNMGAGFVAGFAGLSWSEARAGFDAYQSRSLRITIHEGNSTQTAERLGWNVGSQDYINTMHEMFKTDEKIDYFRK